ncbi:cytochrome c [Motiliproteus sp. SC1-56]|uniref:c-type cytochrome n=1 Tax=Motiliproteus sp. SC1-56 TaxID=2799565 RepID=UPI001A8EE17E|nr:cytochrome c [Motiliproteus sp. SC1-56]
MIINRVPVFAVLVVLVGCGAEEPLSANRGEQLFNETCAGCHKENGKGNFIAGIPASANTQLNQEQIVQLIRQGMPRFPEMPSFPHLTQEDAEQVARHLRDLAQAD